MTRTRYYLCAFCPVFAGPSVWCDGARNLDEALEHYTRLSFHELYELWPVDMYDDLGTRLNTKDGVDSDIARLELKTLGAKYELRAGPTTGVPEEYLYDWEVWSAEGLSEDFRKLLDSLKRDGPSFIKWPLA